MCVSRKIATKDNWAGLLAHLNKPAPGIGDTGHNISPPLSKQLVLELEVGLEILELLEQLPSSVVVGAAASSASAGSPVVSS